MSIEEHVDRTRFTLATFEEAEAQDVDYWLSKTPAERIEALEYLRRRVYGDAQVDARLQRVFQVARLGEG